MREILFRGKRFMDGAFVDGSLFVDEKKDKHEILVGYVNYRVGWEVDPATVGQFTGLLDKNGTKIFEGDIVRHYNRTDVGDPLENEVGAIRWNETWCSFERTSFPVAVRIRNGCVYEVIGNIHDNPDLLKEASDG